MFKRKIQPKTINDATQFKVAYTDCSKSDRAVEYREFNSQKSMEQWIERNDFIAYLIINRFALIDDNWEPFTVIGKKTVTLSELKDIIRRLEDDGFIPSKKQKSKNKNHHKASDKEALNQL